jgi:hypothetical protein
VRSARQLLGTALSWEPILIVQEKSIELRVDARSHTRTILLRRHVKVDMDVSLVSHWCKRQLTVSMALCSNSMTGAVTISATRFVMLRVPAPGM